jgi:hypothetical protein
VERVLLNALAKRAFGDLFVIVFRPGESSIGEADPPEV